MNERSDEVVGTRRAEQSLQEEPDRAAGSFGPTRHQQPGGANFCGVAAAVAILGDAWTLLLVRDLAHGPRRFGELQASTGMSARVLSQRLRAMSAEGLVSRHVFAEIPPRVEYALSDKGRDAEAVVAALRTFGEKWLRSA